MKQAPHSLLAGLFHQAAAPAQLLEQARSAQATLDGLASGLDRVGFDAVDPWAALLEAPLASAAVGTGLQAALDQLAAAAVAPDQTPAAAHAARARPRDAAPTSAARAGGAPRDGVTRRHERATASPARAAAAAVSSAAGAATARPAAATGISARSAAATWQQRAAEANLQAAYAAPLPPLARAALPGPAPDPAGERSDTTQGRAMRRPPAGQAAIAATARAFAEQEVASDGSVQQRLNAVLERIGQGRAPALAEVERSVAWGSRPPAEMAEASLRPDAASASPSARAAAWPAASNGDVAPETRRSAAPAAEPRALPTAGSGLRGLAARAAAWQPAPLRSPTGSSPAAPALAAEPGAAPLADDQLVEQLARLLKREAQRDGIDVSDVSP